MKKLTYIILIVASLLLVSSCNRLDVLGMVVNRSDTEERVADWLDWNAQNGMPVIEDVPDDYDEMYFYGVGMIKSEFP